MPSEETPLGSDSAELTVAAATRTEALAGRWVLRGLARVVRVGVACRRGAPAPAGPLVVCGLAGGLSPELAPGTVLIPEEVGDAEGWRGRCDPELVGRLVVAARLLGREPVLAPLLSVPFLVRGSARAEWARRGYVAVDMESAVLVRSAGAPAAVVRVVLDTPGRELVRSLPWAPQYAARAAAVVRELLRLRRQPRPSR
jgi:Phosphorylase superfamily